MREKAPRLAMLLALAAFFTAAAWKPTLTKIFLEATAILCFKRPGESTGGLVLGMSMILVKPPAAAADVPLVKSSL